MMSGDLGAARLHGEEGLEIIQQLGDEQGIATSHNNLGLVARISGDLDRAANLFTSALDNYRLREDRRGIAAASSNLAIVSRHRGERERALALALEALRLYTDLGFYEGQLDCLEAIAAVAADEGDPERAFRLLSVTTRVREELGTPLFVPDELAQVHDALSLARGALRPGAIERIALGAGELTLREAVVGTLGELEGRASSTIRPSAGSSTGSQ